MTARSRGLLGADPGEAGLYDPAYEHDACGVAFVARLGGEATHETVVRALAALARLAHRGAAGADADTGDGAGILVGLPDAFLRAVAPADLPESGAYGVGVLFLPQEEQRAAELERLVASTVEAEGQAVLGWRDVPVDAAHVGSVAGACAPLVRHVFVAAAPELRHDQDAFERKLYVIRRMIELAAGPDLSIPSFSSRTLVYKGMLSALQLSGTTPTSSTRDCRRSSPWSTRATRRTRSRAGSWRIPTGCSRTTGRSTPCGATSTG